MDWLANQEEAPPKSDFKSKELRGESLLVKAGEFIRSFRALHLINIGQEGSSLSSPIPFRWEIVFQHN